MDLTKLSKTELLARCEELGIAKCKSKNKNKLIEIIEKTQKVDSDNEKDTIVENNSVDLTSCLSVENTEYESPLQELEINKIHNEDCIIGMKKIKSESVDIIICDPPYNIGKDFGNDSDKQKMDEYLLWCDKWISECLRILKPRNNIYLWF